MQANGSSKPATGRPPGAPGIRAQAARYAAGSLAVLSKIANCEQAPDTDRVRAAEVILSHAARQLKASTPEDSA